MKIVMEADHTATDIQNEMVEYLVRHKDETNGVLAETECPFQFWRENEDVFSRLSLMALKYLSAPGASIASERLFSVSGQIVSNLRHRMSPENTEMLLFLAVNLPKVEQTKPLQYDVAKLTFRV